MGAPDGRTRILIGGRGHGTSVKDDEIGVGGAMSREQSFFRELAFYRGAIRLRCAASEVLYEKSSH